ncbi:MAG: hypothetical protein WCI05_01090 [Myxococcales bacterium]
MVRLETGNDDFVTCAQAMNEGNRSVDCDHRTIDRGSRPTVQDDRVIVEGDETIDREDQTIEGPPIERSTTAMT